MRKERRGLESERHVAASRRREVAGRVEERVDRSEAELEGRNFSAAAASSFNLFRRLCGGSEDSAALL